MQDCVSHSRSQRPNQLDDIELEQQSEQLNNESKELLSLYHKTFDDEKVLSFYRLDFSTHPLNFHFNFFIVPKFKPISGLPGTTEPNCS